MLAREAETPEAEIIHEEETLRDLLLRYRSIPDDAHALVNRIFALVSNSFFRISYRSEHGMKHFFLNRHSKRMLRDFLFGQEELDASVSDYMKDYVFGEVYDLTVTKHRKKKESEGAAFAYVNTSGVDLRRYQIYAETDERDETHCLLFALKAQGVDVDIITNFVSGRYIVMQKLKKIALKLGIVIRLHILNAEGRKHVNRYPKKGDFEKTVDIALYLDHYFVFDTLVDAHRAQKNSLALVYALDQEGLFVPHVWVEKASTPKEVSLAKCLGEQKPASLKEKKVDEKVSISFADTECILKPHHEAFLYACHYSYAGESNYRVYQETGNWRGLKSFLNSFGAPRNIIYFHNLKYDWFVIRKCPYLHVRSVLVKDGAYYKILFVYGRRLFELRDSYKLIPKKLAEFPRAFGLEGMVKKQFILYDLYTKENAFDTEHDSVRVEDYDGQEYEQCYCICDRAYSKCSEPVADSLLLDGRIVVPRAVLAYCGRYFVDDTYYHLAHCRAYLHDDCQILRRGVEVFRKAALAIIGVDCFQELTLPSMANRAIFNAGHYAGVYSVEDNLRRFLSLAVRGGGVCARDNAMWHVKGRIVPIDAKSMYPSAIHRICREGGFPCGPARAFSVGDPSTFDPSVYYYVVRVRILSVGKSQQIPFISYIGKDGERINTNEPPPVPVVVDKITLEDWIHFCKIEYEFIEGVYWCEGGNATMGEFVETVYKARSEYAAEDNVAMSEVCKLLMNSVYGKTIVKEKPTKTVVRDLDRADEYISNNFEQLVSMENCGSQVIFEVMDETFGHENLCHVGGMILSMAKRMNYEIIDLAGDLGVVILYHDTDSLHVLDSPLGVAASPDKGGAKSCEDGALKRLADAYAERYGRVLLGNDLEQYAPDLKWPGHDDVHSSECIILGKKVYIHRVVGTLPDGTQESFLLPRIAGINSAALSAYEDKWDLYRRMYDGEEVEFDLTYGDGVSFCFRDVVTCRESFLRKLSFHGPKKELH